VRFQMKPAFLLIAVVIYIMDQRLVEAGLCPGVCQDNSHSCPSGYKSGLCPGPSNIQCCPEATPNCVTGQCQQTTLPCAGGYKTGLCPGPSTIACCMPLNTRAGFDVSVALSLSTAKCLQSQGYTWGAVRAWRSTGSFDPAATGSLAVLNSIGIPPDVYMFPCVGQQASSQVSSMVSQLQASNSQFGTVWLDVEYNPSSTCNWSTNPTTNCNYLQDLVDAVRSHGLNVGIYSSLNYWTQYFGVNGCTYASASAVPLWYARYESDPTCNAFTPFGGWTNGGLSTVWHQWQGDANVCDIDLDINAACH